MFSRLCSSWSLQSSGGFVKLPGAVKVGDVLKGLSTSLRLQLGRLTRVLVSSLVLNVDVALPTQVKGDVSLPAQPAGNKQQAVDRQLHPDFNVDDNETRHLWGIGYQGRLGPRWPGPAGPLSSRHKRRC